MDNGLLPGVWEENGGVRRCTDRRNARFIVIMFTVGPGWDWPGEGDASSEGNGGPAHAASSWTKRNTSNRGGGYGREMQNMFLF